MFQLELDSSLRTTEPNARTVGGRKDNAKRRELQMADLASGNLNEEKNAHSTQRLHASGPQHQPRNLLFRYVT